MACRNYKSTQVTQLDMLDALPLAWFSNFALATVDLVWQGWPLLSDSSARLILAVFEGSAMIGIAGTTGG